MKRLIIFTLLALGGTASHAAVKNVAAGGNLSSAIKKSVAGDTLMLAGGDYLVEGSIAASRDLVIMAGEGARAKVSFSTFVVGSGARHLSLENLDILLNRKYLVQTADMQCDIDLIQFKGCRIDLGGATGATLVTSGTPGEERNRIGEIRLEDCIVHNGGFPLHAIYGAGSTSKTSVEKISVLNSTVANTARGLFVSPATMESIEITLRNSTFYHLNATDNEAGTIRFSGAKATVTIEGCVFNFAGLKSRFIIVGPGSRISVVNSYMTGEMATIPGQNGLKRIEDTASAAFAAPGDDPTAEGVSFKVKNSVLAASKVGDPRWDK